MLIRKTVLCSKKTAQTGALKRKELGEQLQGIDYIYTVNGQLKSINQPSLDETLDPGQDGNTGSSNAAFGKDVFGLTLDYHTDDYLRHNSNILSSASGGTNLYNGLISAQRYKTRAVTNSVPNGADKIDPASLNITLITGTTDEIMNRYSYDEEYRLSTSVFGLFNNSTEVFTANANNYFKEYGASANSGIGYDANGNITSLKRNGYIAGGNLAMDDFTYTYLSNTNKLTSIVDAAASSYGIDLVAATSKTFTSNSIGQMTTSEAEEVTDITYYATGLTKKVSFGSSRSAEYWYDDRGQKIKTKFYNSTSSKAKYTWYVSDAGSNPLAIYEYDEAVAGSPVFVLASQPVYGSGRIGVLDNTTGIIDYEITDNLGNVRATIKGISTGVYQLTTRTDYYAFGGVQPGRTYNLNTYRFNYQGQESAVNSKWQAFDLRMHNSDLGRWFAPDPYGQFHSPYVSMDNNPINGTDPDGGYYIGNDASRWRGYGQTEGKKFNNGWDQYVYDSQINDANYKSAYQNWKKHWGDGWVNGNLSSADAQAALEVIKRQYGKLENTDLGRAAELNHNMLMSSNNAIGDYDRHQTAIAKSGVVTQWLATDKDGNKQYFDKDQSDAANDFAYGKIEIDLPVVNIEDVGSQLHDVVQYTLNHLDEFANTDLSNTSWNDLNTAAFSERFETNKGLNGQAGNINQDYSLEKLLMPSNMIKTLYSLTNIATTKSGGGGRVITMGRTQYVGPRYQKTTLDYSRSFKIWKDTGGKQGKGGWEHVWDWNSWGDFLKGGQ